MDREPSTPAEVKTLWTYFRDGIRKANKARPFSFYLLLLMPVILYLGAQLGALKAAPKSFALVLGLLFLAFFLIIGRAAMDCFDILRRHLSERRTLYSSTISDEQFMEQLRERVRGQSTEGRE